MARTLNVIYQEILGSFTADTTNFPNQSTSQVAKWRLIASIVAGVIYTFELLFDAFKTEVKNYIDTTIPGTVPWYHAQTLLFQYGDALVYQNDRFEYTAIDETKKIIKRCAVSEYAGQVRIKVSKEVGGVPEELDSNEKDAFMTYINKVKFAGTNIAIINYPPDLIKLELDVVYDALLLNPDGSLITDDSIFPVDDAINAYLKNIVYGGIFNKTKLIDAIQQATGVIDPILQLAEGKANNAATFTTIDQNYEFIAGYAVISSLTINYSANV